MHWFCIRNTEKLTVHSIQRCVGWSPHQGSFSSVWSLHGLPANSSQSLKSHCLFEVKVAGNLILVVVVGGGFLTPTSDVMSEREAHPSGQGSWHLSPRRSRPGWRSVSFICTVHEGRGAHRVPLHPNSHDTHCGRLEMSSTARGSYMCFSVWINSPTLAPPRVCRLNINQLSTDFQRTEWKKMFLQGFFFFFKKKEKQSVKQYLEWWQTLFFKKKNRRNVFNCRPIIKAIQAGRKAEIFVN